MPRQQILISFVNLGLKTCYCLPTVLSELYTLASCIDFTYILCYYYSVAIAYKHVQVYMYMLTL